MFDQASMASVPPRRSRLRVTIRHLSAGLVLCLSPALAMPAIASAPPAQADGQAYRDDRSTGETLVRSLYNAINRHELLRAYSYFGEASNPPRFEDFAKGYENTDHVRLKLGKVTEEGAAGSLFANVPVAIEATDKDGGETVFSGCYVTRLTQPALQETPPFVPLHIERASLEKVNQSFKSVKPTCPDQ